VEHRLESDLIFGGGEDVVSGQDSQLGRSSEGLALALDHIGLAWWGEHISTSSMML
jgi:hypothetical protein